MRSECESLVKSKESEVKRLTKKLNRESHKNNMELSKKDHEINMFKKKFRQAEKENQDKDELIKKLKTALQEAETENAKQRRSQSDRDLELYYKIVKIIENVHSDMMDFSKEYRHQFSEISQNASIEATLKLILEHMSEHYDRGVKQEDYEYHSDYDLCEMNRSNDDVVHDKYISPMKTLKSHEGRSSKQNYSLKVTNSDENPELDMQKQEKVVTMKEIEANVDEISKGLEMFRKIQAK